uniref:Uncharacterized protein n=1 Tax=Arundo donax TaxID=35708 RepID=A0A0A9AP39_ARUDO
MRTPCNCRHSCICSCKYGEKQSDEHLDHALRNQWWVA